jgi:hypothetical protein
MAVTLDTHRPGIEERLGEHPVRLDESIRKLLTPTELK